MRPGRKKKHIAVARTVRPASCRAFFWNKFYFFLLKSIDNIFYPCYTSNIKGGKPGTEEKRMAKWECICVCEKCGKEFSRSGFARNRAEADNREDWVKKNPGLCRDCWKAEKSEEEEEFLRSLPLPELTGTEKQIQYAEDLRRGFILRHCTRQEFAYFVGKGSAEEYAKGKAKIAERLEEAKHNHNIKIVTCLWETDAGYMISLLK